MFDFIIDYIKKRTKKGTFLRKVLRRAYLIIRKCSPNFILKYIYRRLFKTSIFFQKSELEKNSLFPIEKLKKTVVLFQPKSVLDLGCGTGKSLDYFKLGGIEVIGVDGSKLAIRHALHPELIIRHDLNKELNLKRVFDLIWSYELVEHIHPKYVNNLLKTFSNHSDVIVMSAAKPGQGGEGHFNEQLPGYWIRMFIKYDYIYNDEKTEEFKKISEKYSENMLVFERKKIIINSKIHEKEN